MFDRKNTTENLFSVGTDQHVVGHFYLVLVRRLLDDRMEHVERPASVKKDFDFRVSCKVLGQRSRQGSAG